jgi:hypothetical protein
MFLRKDAVQWSYSVMTVGFRWLMIVYSLHDFLLVLSMVKEKDVEISIYNCGLVYFCFQINFCFAFFASLLLGLLLWLSVPYRTHVEV